MFVLSASSMIERRDLIIWTLSDLGYLIIKKWVFLKIMHQMPMS